MKINKIKLYKEERIITVVKDGLKHKELLEKGFKEEVEKKTTRKRRTKKAED